MINYRISKLNNGITVASERIEHVNSFSLGFWFNVGSRDETNNTNGISHLLEHMFFKGTRNRTATKISEEIESLGGYLNAFTSKEHTCYYGRGMKKYLHKTFLVLADMVQNSIFDEKELKKEAKVVIDELHDIEDSPDELIMPIIGTENNVINFSRDDLIKYVDNNYCTENFYVVASGDIDHNSLVSMTEKYFLSVKSQKRSNRRKFKSKIPQNQFFYKDMDVLFIP